MLGRRPHRLLVCALMALAPLISPGMAQGDDMARARAAIQAADYTTAVSLLRTHVGRQERDDQAWFVLGVAHTHLEEFHQAIDAFRHVIALRPHLAQPHHNLAVIYYRLGDLPAATRELEAAVQKQPADATAHVHLGDLYVQLALKHYQQAMQGVADADLMERYQRLLRVRNAQTAAADRPAP